MNILSFGQFAREKKLPLAQDWSNQELADFFRAHKLLVNNGASIGMDRGRSDVGEPWMVFYHTTSQDVFLHIARIDNRCILVCEHLDIRISAMRIETLVSKFEEEIRQAFALRTDRPSNVIVHPAAKIIMSISAVFLLFKLDTNSQTFAKESLGAGGDAAARKSDGFHVRVQATLARLFDGAETPAAMAALASVILATEIALDHRERDQGTDSESEQSLGLAHTHETSLQLHRADVAVDGDPQTADVALVAEGPPSALPADPTLVTVVESIAGDMAVAATVHTLAAKDFVPMTSQAEVNAAESAASGPAASVAEAELATAPAILPTVAAPAAVTLVALADEPLAVQIMQIVAPLDFDTLVTALNSGVLVSATGEISRVTSLGPETELNEFGFMADTDFATGDLTLMLEHIISSIGDYRLDINGSALSIVQITEAVMDQADLGIWTNMMSDGSSITIVGAVDLIDDVGWLLTVA